MGEELPPTSYWRSNLLDRHTFPPHSKLIPKHEREICLRTLTPVEHWCFFAQIRQVLNTNNNLILLAHDFEGEEVGIMFPKALGKTFYENNEKLLKPGNTAAILYVDQTFLHGARTVEVHSLARIKIFPYTLDELLLANKAIWDQKENAPDERQCDTCKQTTGMMCASCKISVYCSKECQKEAYKEHKRPCRAIKAVRWSDMDDDNPWFNWDS